MYISVESFLVLFLFFALTVSVFSVRLGALRFDVFVRRPFRPFFFEGFYIRPPLLRRLNDDSKSGEHEQTGLVEVCRGHYIVELFFS